jgi:hypothetical protein
MFTSKTKGATVPRQFLVLAATAVVSVAVTAITPAFSASMGGQRARRLRHAEPTAATTP